MDAHLTCLGNFKSGAGVNRVRIDPGRLSTPPHSHGASEEIVFVLAGSGQSWQDEQVYEVGPGDCVATGMGHHHDFPLVVEPVRAVFFETTLAGQKRRGHLWDHTHGAAAPKADRV